MLAIETDFMSSNIPLMYLPLTVDGLLMPDVAIVAVSSRDQVKRKDDGPEWLIGNINWRGSTIPVIDFDILNGHSPSEDMGRRIDKVVIVASTADHGHLPYYAISISESPQMLFASDDEIHLHEARPRGRAEAMSVSVKQFTGGIPNVAWIEQHLLACILHC